MSAKRYSCQLQEFQIYPHVIYQASHKRYTSKPNLIVIRLHLIPTILKNSNFPVSKLHKFNKITIIENTHCPLQVFNDTVLECRVLPYIPLTLHYTSTTRHLDKDKIIKTLGHFILSQNCHKFFTCIVTYIIYQIA